MTDFCRLLTSFAALDQNCLMPSDGIPESIFNKKLKDLSKECQENKIKNTNK